MMTAENQPEDLTTVHPTADLADPIGPITLPKRSLIGSRAMALVGAAGVLAIGAMELTDTCGTVTTSVSVY
jgi:hypothetical protein